MLVKPFKETDAYKLGIIDVQGNVLISPKDFTTQQQRDAYNYLTRLVFNIKKLINKLPGGNEKLKNIIAALFLVKEAYSNRSVHVDEQRLNRLIRLLDSGVVLAEQQLIVEQFMMLQEDAPANSTGSAVSTDVPAIRKPRRFARFDVSDETFNKFANGKTKFRKWSQYLNIEDQHEKKIYDFARSNPKGVIVLHNGDRSKAIRFNRRGGGRWSKITRKQINNQVV
jgi:hypothetical protein